VVGFRLAVDAHQLLADGVHAAGHDARLAGRCYFRVDNNPVCWYALVPEHFNQGVAVLIVADESDWNGNSPERPDVRHGVCSAAVTGVTVPEIEYQDRRLA